MNHFDELSKKLQKLCKPRITEYGTLDTDLCISGFNIDLLFCTNVFKDGCFLAFWSHSPWGCVHNGDEGWAVLSPTLETLDECETKSFHMSSRNDFRAWRKQQTLEHGKSFKLMAEWTNEAFWKITEC